MSSNQITALNYNLEPVDHLYMIYGDFGRRNDINEWVYFLSRPELSDKQEFRSIADTLLEYMVKYNNISQEVVQMIENTFHFARDRAEYEKNIGYEEVETYCRYMLETKEFPPYELFDGYDETKDYDSYIYEFRDMFFNYTPENPAEYLQRLDDLKKTGIRHPYIVFLESEYLALCEEWETTISILDTIDDCYHKFMHKGLLFSSTGNFDLAEACYEKAMSMRTHNLDPVLITDYLMSKWNSGKESDALIYADKFEQAGYEYVVMPVKQMFIEELSKVIMENSNERDLSENELLILTEMYRTYGDYNKVTDIVKYSRDHGFDNELWTIYASEAYFETGNHEEAQQIVDLVYDGTKKLTPAGILKIKEVKARILHEKGRIGDAYEIMENICRRPESTMSQKYNLTKMYLKTGKFESAYRLLSELKYKSPDNLFYTYDFGKCCMQTEEYEKALSLFIQVYNENPEFRHAAYHAVECAVEQQDDKKVEAVMDLVKEHLSGYEIRYFNGMIQEMNEDFKGARETYRKLADEYKEDIFPEELLYQVYLRYFIMVEETNGKLGAMIRDIENTLAAYPCAADLWLYLADIHESTEYMEENIERCFSMALKADPFNTNAMLGLLSIYTDNENSAKEWELSNRLVECSDLPEGYLFRAQSGYNSGNTDQCMKDLNKYEQLGGDMNQALELRAAIAMFNGEYEAAYKYCEERLKTRKTSEIPCYDELALCMCKMGRYEEAAETLDIACENSRIGDHYATLYNIQMHMGKFSDAAETLKRYSKMCDVNRLLDDDYLLMSAWLSTESEKWFKAQSTAETIPSRDGERLCAIHEMINMNYRKASKLFKKLVKKEPDEIDNYSWCSLALRLKGADAESVSCARQGLAVFKEQNGDVKDIKSPYFLCQYAFLNTLCNECEEAVRTFEHALEMPTCHYHPCNECYEAHYGLGMNHLLNGNKQDAMIEFDKSLKIKPANIVCRKMRELI